ncbi:MAG: hypothetical protein ACREVA_08965 [Burkholderiales bacterium]
MMPPSGSRQRSIAIAEKIRWCWQFHAALSTQRRKREVHHD